MVSLLAGVSLVCLSSLALQAAGTRVGDTHHGNTETGLFYIFGPEITIVDPDTASVVTTLDGVSEWGDTVYMRDHAQIHHYVFANDRENQKLWVIDTDAKEVLSMVDIGDNPFHVYAIPSREEIWTHPDTTGAFDILHLGDLDYLAHSNLKVHVETPGHSKMLWDPNLQDQAFATNEEEAFLFEIDLEEREVASTVNMTLDSAAYPCASTHGIGYSYVNQHLYVECNNPSTCDEDSSTDGTICSGTAWEVDVPSLTPVARLESPTLSDRYNGSFGAQGQVYGTPDERFIVLANKDHNFLHFLKPVDGGDTIVIDVEVTLIPGRVVFYPKDGNDVWGPDSELKDYWAVIGQEGQVAEAGVIMIDLEEVATGFEAEEPSGTGVTPHYIPIGAGAKHRPVSRGSHYAMTPSGATTEDGGYTEVALIDLENKEVTKTFEVAGTWRVQWVPTHTDEVVADHEIRITALETAQANAEGEDDDDNDGGVVAVSGAAADATMDPHVETMAEAAVALAVVGFVGAMLSLFVSVRNARHTKAVSEGQFKPFACF